MSVRVCHSRQFRAHTQVRLYDASVTAPPYSLLTDGQSGFSTASGKLMANQRRMGLFFPAMHGIIGSNTEYIL